MSPVYSIPDDMEDSNDEDNDAEGIIDPPHVRRTLFFLLAGILHDHQRDGQTHGCHLEGNGDAEDWQHCIVVVMGLCDQHK